MKILFILGLVMLVLQGCASSEPRAAYAENDREAYIIECADTKMSVPFKPSCEKQADKVCPQGWLVDTQSSHGYHNDITGQSGTDHTWKIICDE